MTTKAECRRNLNARVYALPPKERDRESKALCERILGDPELNAAAVIGIYLALPDEPNLRPALDRLLDSGRQLALPVCEPDGSWTFRAADTLDGPSTGPWGLTCPEPGPIVDPSLLDYVLVPGRGFTRDGHRIGRGKGIYDRLLSGVEARTLGIAFRCQVVDQLPQEPHDLRMDEVWTAD